MSRKKLAGVFFFLSVFLIVIVGLLFIVRPPGEPHHSESHDSVRPVEQPYMTNEGKLPGVTWADDIHLIFVRNRCGACHTRGEEDAVEGLTEFALGLIDPEAPSNSYYSYHELVYAEGPPQNQKGERFRDGQCCWPRDFPPDKQRRIWVGHAERSVLMRKLDRDYYDWEKPPRFLEEGLGLLWGLPMPWYHEKAGHSHDEPGDIAHEKEREHKHGGEREVHGNGKDEHGYEVRSFFKRILFHISLWVGLNRDKLQDLPPRIPERDRALIRYWINNVLQLMNDGTAIEVRVVDGRGRPVKDSMVQLIGNFNVPERAKVRDVIDIMTDVKGRAVLSFPELSVITSFWFISAVVDGKSTGYRSLSVMPGKINKIELTS
jgi:hypothetical protein